MKKNLDKQTLAKYMALLEEFETSNKLIILGLGEIQNISLGNNFHFLPFQLLSQGFERFMKAYICLAFENANGNYPGFLYLRGLGHDLKGLLDEIMNHYFFDFKRPQHDEDLAFLQGNKDLSELLFIISEFGKKSRYYNFDLITESKALPVNAVDLWRQFENKYLLADHALLSKLFSRETEAEVFQKLNAITIIVFERFVSALSRQMLFGCLGDNGKQMSASSFQDFAMMYDKDFGRKDYRTYTTRYKETPRNVHKRTWKDEFDRKWNPQYKSKRILKEEYEGDWPFYHDEVIVECRHGIWCVVTIDGHDYALNGSAKGKYKLDNPHDAGMAILDKPFADFIKIAREL